MTDDDKDEDVNEGDHPDTLAEFLSNSFMSTPALDFDEAYDAVNSH